MNKVPANFQVNQIIGSLAINWPVMYVKRSKIVTVRLPLWIFFSNLDFFPVFFFIRTSLHQKIQRKVSFFKKLLVHSKSPLNYFTERLLVICGLDAISFSLNSYCGTHAEDPEHKNQVWKIYEIDGGEKMQWIYQHLYYGESLWNKKQTSGM